MCLLLLCTGIHPQLFIHFCCCSVFYYKNIHYLAVLLLIVIWVSSFLAIINSDTSLLVTLVLISVVYSRRCEIACSKKLANSFQKWFCYVTVSVEIYESSSCSDNASTLVFSIFLTLVILVKRLMFSLAFNLNFSDD